jgi:hypothetical protein
MHLVILAMWQAAIRALAWDDTPPAENKARPLRF